MLECSGSNPALCNFFFFFSLKFSKFMPVLFIGTGAGAVDTALDIIIFDHTKVITQLVYYTNNSLSQPTCNLYRHSKLINFILVILYTEMQIFIHMSHSNFFLKVGNYDFLFL